MNARAKADLLEARRIRAEARAHKEAAVVRALRDGLSVPEVHRVVGVSVETVRAIRDRHGIEARKGWAL
ncbi:MAG: hypothetical protein FJ298_14230 [Planctomycetes bacterium]|nr:hypothetical protein [Planctomycetota bacterium]